MARGRADGRRVVDLSSTIDSATTDRSKRRAVFVSNLPIGATEEEIHARFETAGTVESMKLWRDHRGGQQLATVTYQFPLDAKRAISTLHHAEFRGRILGLAFAR